MKKEKQLNMKNLYLRNEMKINHIGYLCRDIENTIQLFKYLGYEKVTDTIMDISGGVFRT